MSPLTKGRLRFAAWSLLGAGALAMSAYALSALLRVDPFAGQRGTEADQGITLENVAMRAYDGGRLAATAEFEQISIQRDRSAAEMLGIHNGTLISDDGDKIFFDGDRATYLYYQNLLSATGGIRVRGKEFDLRSDAFNYDERAGTMLVPNEITGTLKGGKVTTANLTYNVAEKTFRFGTATWIGKIKDPRTGRQSRWHVKSAPGSVATGKGSIMTFPDAWATDGQVIVTADKVVLNNDTDVLTATGAVEYFSADANVIAQKAVVFSEEKRAVLTGAVSMLIKPEQQKKLEEVELQPFRPVVPTEVSAERPLPPPVDSEDHPVRDPDNLRDYPVMVLADKVEYWYGEGSERAVFTGSPQARQEFPDGEWRMVWAVSGLYDGAANTLRLESGAGEREVQIKTSLKDEIFAQWFLISTAEGNDTWSAGSPTGFISMDDDDIPPTGPPPPAIKGKIGGES